MIDITTLTAKQILSEEIGLWSNPVFTPDGEYLIVAPLSRVDIEWTGQAFVYFQHYDLNGQPISNDVFGGEISWALTDVAVSPNGQLMAYAVGTRMNCCQGETHYVVHPIGSSQIIEIESTSLRDKQKSIPPNESYYRAFDFSWSPDSESAAIIGHLEDGEYSIIGEPQLSIVGLDGVERLVVAGDFRHPSYDRTGNLLAVEKIEDGRSVIQIYSVVTGELIMTVGEGSLPIFEP